jgi:hypothetical protein
MAELLDDRRRGRRCADEPRADARVARTVGDGNDAGDDNERCERDERYECPAGHTCKTRTPSAVFPLELDAAAGGTARTLQSWRSAARRLAQHPCRSSSRLRTTLARGAPNRHSAKVEAAGRPSHRRATIYNHSAHCTLDVEGRLTGSVESAIAEWGGGRT